MSESFELVRLPSGAFSVRSKPHQETFHPVLGPAAEAEALYVRQPRLLERLQRERDEFVVWDVGLGAAANPLTLLNSARNQRARIHLVSFDRSIEALRFALRHHESLPYLRGFECELENLITTHHVQFSREDLSVDWEFHLGDFPSWLQRPESRRAAKPHAIFYDAFSPARNPAMWTLPLFTQLHHLLDPNRPCVMPTYSRSTLLRATLLLSGFYVGRGHCVGQKEETTIAANDPALIDQPLGREWLLRARRSRAAEPLREPVYRQAPLSAVAWESLREHPQFRFSCP